MKIKKIAISLGACFGMLAANVAYSARNADLEVFYFDEAGNLLGESYTPCLGPTQYFGVQEGLRVEGFSTPCRMASYSMYCTAHRQQRFDPARTEPWYWESMNDTINRCLAEAQILMI